MHEAWQVCAEELHTAKQGNDLNATDCVLILLDYFMWLLITVNTKSLVLIIKKVHNTEMILFAFLATKQVLITKSRTSGYAQEVYCHRS